MTCHDKNWQYLLAHSASLLVSKETTMTLAVRLHKHLP